jgi:3-phosphoshikimate 1-carboxyvinyltransferase
MPERITPASSLRGTIRLPGDKSISHRYAILASLAEGQTTIQNYSTGADCQSTLGAMRALGNHIETNGDEVEICGAGLRGLKQPAGQLDAGNSGSTIRMLSGILAAQPFPSVIAGDESLSRRPMVRIMKPLARMGASIRAREDRFPPLEIDGTRLTPIEYELPVASAQVKTCVLFAGMFADGETTVIEPVHTRDHTEIALREFGADISIDGLRITLQGRPRLMARELTVPGDISSAAFYLVAATIIPNSSLMLENVGLNPTRAALLDFLSGMGARIRIDDLRQVNGELVGNLHVESATVQGGVIEGALTAALIDEIPILAVLGAASEEGLDVRDAGELRVKETDRIASVADNLERMGVAVEVREDGFTVPGRQRFRAAEFDSYGDHRIAMAFAVGALAADGESSIKNAAAASVSYPEFFGTLNTVRA